MDQYPIASRGTPSAEPGRIAGLEHGGEILTSLHDRTSEPLRFPGEDGGRSLNDMATRDLEAALQLLAERAQYITGASGAAIALREGEEMVCRASAGPSAPVVGSRAEVSSGLSGESVRTRQLMCCHDAASDPRVDQDSCKAMSIASAMVMPLLCQGQVVGVFELLSGRVHAFEERDMLALERMGEMIQTAIDHTEAAKNAQTIIAAAADSMAAGVVQYPVAAPKAGLDSRGGPPSAGSGLVERGNIKGCSACGFPVSEGRTLCLDCSNSRTPQTPLADPIVRESPMQVPAFALHTSEEGWVQSHRYLIGTLLVAAITVTAVIFLR
jgi:putative methionine-R-sulfoxide reductase with GAF domain